MLKRYEKFMCNLGNSRFARSVALSLAVQCSTRQNAMFEISSELKMFLKVERDV